MEGSVPQRAATLAMLRQLERKVLWLSSYMIHHANHEVDRGDGLKVGGHQASSASLVTLMTALYFHVLRPEDRVAVKPHASPVFHAIQYLLGNQTLDKLQAFRAFGGAQSYPSRTKTRRTWTFRLVPWAWESPRPALPAWCRTTCMPRAGAAGGRRAA